MRIVAVISPKGGVGKTTVTANLASTLASIGERINLLDLDPQNALRLHFGQGYDETAGIACPQMQHGDWRQVQFESGYGVDFLPYGVVDEPQREALESYIRSHPDWLITQLNTLQLPEDAVVLIDTPPGPSVYLQQVLQVANVALVVLKPDAASYSTVPSIEALIEHYAAGQPHFLGYCYVINQMDASKQLSRDVFGMLRNSLGGRFVPVTIHRDEAVSEALACQMPVSYYAEHSSAAYDMQQLAAWLQKHFGLID